jgi:peptide-methionine (R)-S-oxide reductase
MRCFSSSILRGTNLRPRRAAKRLRAIFDEWRQRRYTLRMSRKVERSEEEWQKVLTDAQYNVTRRKGTERAFTGEYWDCHDPGIYHCVACGEQLFKSDDKFDSGSGWPSFKAPASPQVVETLNDFTHSMRRTEVVCEACGAHLGHLFEDGPAPSGQRYCINSAALKLERK